MARREKLGEPLECRGVDDACVAGGGYVVGGERDFMLDSPVAAPLYAALQQNFVPAHMSVTESRYLTAGFALPINPRRRDGAREQGTCQEKAKGLTYADAGVDIDAGNRLVDMIRPAVRATQRRAPMARSAALAACST